MAQPGTNAEGKDDEKEASTDYKCVFRKSDDSIYIMLKDTKSKRAFSNTFSKSTLLEMDLKSSIDEIINLLKTAKSGSDSSLTFQVAFGDAENTKTVSIDKLSLSYIKGYAAYIIISIKMSWMLTGSEYYFKLLEQSYVNIFYAILPIYHIYILSQHAAKQIYCMILLLICNKKLMR